jgi:hypothetical protein
MPVSLVGLGKSIELCLFKTVLNGSFRRTSRWWFVDWCYARAGRRRAPVTCLASAAKELQIATGVIVAANPLQRDREICARAWSASTPVHCVLLRTRFLLRCAVALQHENS